MNTKAPTRGVDYHQCVFRLNMVSYKKLMKRATDERRSINSLLQIIVEDSLKRVAPKTPQ